MTDTSKVARGSLSKNAYKNAENQPEYTGNITFDQPARAGDKLKVAAWVRTGQDGSRYMSLSISVPQTKPGSSYAGGGSKASDMDDDIPFFAA